MKKFKRVSFEQGTGMSLRYMVFAFVCSLFAAQGVEARTIHVAKTGDDGNSGAEASPYLTINHAAQQAQPGDTVMVHEGTYREQVDPARGGTSEDARIVYKAADGDTVAIKGSERITSWKDQGGGVWLVILPNSFFVSYNPYDLKMSGEWLKYGDDKHRGDVYLDGEAFIEQLSLSEIADKKSWYCEVTESETKIWANFGSVNPNNALTEINVREAVFYPKKAGCNYITVDGFYIAHAANNWGSPIERQVGMIFPRDARSWIIENCTIVNARAIGISLGRYDSGAAKDIEDIGHHIVRNNIIRRCGQSGIAGLLFNSCSLIEHNLIEETNYRDEFGGFETAAIKFHAGTDTIIRNNLIRGVNGKKGAHGIWIDWGNQGTRVSGNIIMETEKLTLFLEANHGPILVDNNIFCGKAVSCEGTEGAVFVHNLFYKSNVEVKDLDDRAPFYRVTHSLVGAGKGRTFTKYQKLYNNIFIGSSSLMKKGEGNAADYNLYIDGSAFKMYNEHSLSSDSPTGFSVNSTDAKVSLSFNMDHAAFTLNCPFITKEFIGLIPKPNQGIEHPDGSAITIDTDFFGNRRNTLAPRVGPFENLTQGLNSVQVFPVVGVEVPNGLVATADNTTNEVSLDWSDYSGDDFGSYNVYRRTDSTSYVEPLTNNLTSSEYVDTTAVAETLYYYVVTAISQDGGESGFSDEVFAALDDDPPTPNPAGFSSAPFAESSSAIRMTATTATDASGVVEYLFTETSGGPGASSSGWQSSASYTDSGLSPNTQYSYTVTYRDFLGNTGSPSAAVRAYTYKGIEIANAGFETPIEGSSHQIGPTNAIWMFEGQAGI